MFYPGNPRELDSVVRQMLSDAASEAPTGPVPKAIIAPHAGYVYSGPIAATAYARLKPAASRIHRVVLLGPCHRVPVRGLAVSGADAFMTPLGAIPVDRGAIERILDLPQVEIFEATHAEEHSLEVHLPFLQEILDDFSLVPLVVGQATADEVAEVLDRLWDGPETLIVVSSDLSQYLDYESARQMDAATCKAIEALDPAAIGYDQACGRVPVAGLLAQARRRGLRVTTLDLRNSGDTAGDRRRVVGYGAWMFTDPEATARRPGRDGPAAETNFGNQTRALLDTHGETLLHLAAASIEDGLACGAPVSVNPADYPQALRDNGACFVTLKRNGQLRGCIGSPRAYRPLVEDVADNGFAAAFRDTRFPKLKPEEKRGLSLSVSVLSPPAPMTFADEADLLKQIRPAVDGLIIEADGRRALFLPQVWESLPRPQAFVAQLKAKAGLARDHWSEDFKAWRFTSEAVESESLEHPEALWG
jgi:AmmeMemoRadiSam system protein B/AmmeMemoRadiSam system protein A